MAISAAQEDWNDIICRGVENQQLDYKAAQNWTELTRAGKAKFARHAMAMANTRGGYIVVGVGEDENGNPTLRTGLTEKQARSFDPSTVGQTINRYADPSVEFDIVRPEVDGKRYVIFVVYPFRGLPHVSGDACEVELQRGVFYIRTPDARSRAAYRASELHGLIQRALRNQRELLGRMIRGVLYEGREVNDAGVTQEFTRLLARCRQESRAVLSPKRLSTSVVFEVATYPGEFLMDRFSLSDLDRVRERLSLPVEGTFPLSSSAGVVSYMTNDSVRSYLVGDEANQPAFYLELFLCGLLYCSVIEHDTFTAGEQRTVAYLPLIRRVGTSVVAIGRAYTELGLETALLNLTFRLVNTEGVFLSLSAREDATSHRCFIPEVEVIKQRTAADLASAPAAHAAKIVREMCERFNFRGDEHVGLNQRLEALLRLPPG